MNSSMFHILVLGIVITALTGKTTASRNTRQAERCSPVQQCILLTKCPELLALLKPPTAAGIKRLNDLRCGFVGRIPKVCCDESGPGTPTPTPTPSPSPSPSPSPTPTPTPSPSPSPTPTPTPTPTPNPTPTPTSTTDLLPKQCGSANGERVFGGTELEVGSYRWMALIGYGNSRSPDWNCGGSLISQRYVITAAHCADKAYTRGQSIVKVRLGEHDITKTRDCQQFNTGELCALPVQDINPEQVIINPTWDKKTNYSDDIALIRLDQPAEFNGYVQPICLPPFGLDVSAFLDGREAEVAGWGYTEGRVFSNVKLVVELPFVPLEKCKAVNHVPLLEKGQVCFGGVVGKDSCSGDSGGPLVSTDLNSNSQNLYILLGVVSYGPPLPTCGIVNRPAVYTDVAQYRNWIVNNLRP